MLSIPVDTHTNLMVLGLYSHSRESYHHEAKGKERQHHKPIWIEKRRRELPRALLSSQKRFDSSVRRSDIDRGMAQPTPPRNLSSAAMKAAMGNLREVMV